MSETIFKRVEYDLSDLIKDIKLGKIGLPDIQRPFVWKNVKVRDLFDSMYRGYPIGYLLLWENGNEGHKQVGIGEKQVAPNLVIVDGQQRLTSLYAVFTAAQVVRANYAEEHIRIAFNPLEQKFDVASAATRQDRAFIPDISVVWSGSLGLIPLYNRYTEALRETRDLSPEDTKTIENSLSRLHALSSFPLTALQLSADISEEDVAEVFVRINSQGKSLNQADFILTLMSVFWDDGRRLLEAFCRQARIPTTGTPSAYNAFIEPSPDQLLRATVGLAFRRARLSSIYSVLRGKNLETGQFSVEHRERQFELLKDAQERVLNLDNWHGFLRCLQQAGFRTKRMVISNTALIYSYVLYLIGRTEVKVGEQEIRTAIAQWFFMASLTGRYTGSPESAMESDLALLRGVHTPKEFLDTLTNATHVVLTNDFWELTLPNELATSASRSPSLFAFEAALVLLDAPVLFSNTKLREWLDPGVKQPNSLERHHLFPKSHLAGQGFQDRQINQIANYAYVEWQDNRSISNHPPSEYVAAAASKFKDEQVKDMYRLNALPEGWEQMAYDEFLKERRMLMARIIRDGYGRLASGPTTSEPAPLDLASIVVAGESDRVEFKSTLRTNLHTGQRDARMEDAIVRTIAGFLNTNGGTLVVGVADDGNPVGIDVDGFDNEDKMSLHLTNLVNSRIGAKAWATIHANFDHANFDDHDDFRVLVVRCERAPTPAYATVANQQHFFVRTGAATVPLSPDEMVEYIKQRFG